MVHAIANAIRIYVQEDGMRMYIGPSRAGSLLEVGTIALRDGHRAIGHAMRVRKKYLVGLR